MAMSFLVFLREILSSGSFEPLLSIILMKTKFSFNPTQDGPLPVFPL